MMVPIHAPPRGATRRRWAIRPCTTRSNPRTPAGCDETNSGQEIALSMFQSTHPRGVRQEPGRDRSSLRAVPIHAPPRGATLTVGISKRELLVPIHAPPRGATLCNHSEFLGAMFQSTHPRGVRHAVGTLYRPGEGVPIHAPPRGATSSRSMAQWRIEFQSTHPRGVRRAPSIGAWTSSCSNPRTPAGCDVEAVGVEGMMEVPIHAPPRGATAGIKSDTIGGNGSNPRTPAGCDGCQARRLGEDGCSNPRTPAGCDPYSAPSCAG